MSHPTWPELSYVAHLLQRNLGDSRLTGHIMASKKLEFVRKKKRVDVE